jgi:hypothetical protein
MAVRNGKSSADVHQIIEEVDSRFQPNASDKLSEIGAQVKSTLLAEPHEMYEPFLPKSRQASSATGHGGAPGYVDGIADDFAMEEEMMVHEAEWGNDKEEGIGEERENDME